jgi:hypothetical protein
MRGLDGGLDGIIPQKTVRKPFEKAASVDVAALTALLRIFECTGYNTKSKKIISRAFSAFFPISSFRKNG